MDIMFVEEPAMGIKSWLEENNCNYVKYGRENPKDVEAIYIQNSNLDFKKYPALQWILCPMTGIGHLKSVSSYKVYHLTDKKFLYKYVWSTAEHTVNLILRLHRGLFKELHGKTIGILGFGRVGQQVYYLLKNWGCKFLYYDPNHELINFNRFVDVGDDLKFVNTAHLFKESDVVTIHIPEKGLTKELISINLLRLCEYQPFIINTSRASLINYKHLVTAFEDGLIAGFGMDIDFDYLKENNSNKIYETMMNLNKIYAGVILSDHIAGKGFESRFNTDLYIFNQFFKDIGGTLKDEDYIGRL